MELLVQIRNLAVEFCDGPARYTALRGIDFEIGRGEIVGLMGESGSGKSTTAISLLGLLPSDSASVRGSVRFRDQELLSLSEREWQKVRGSQISLVFQEPEIALSPVMRAGDQVAEVIHAHQNWNWRRCRGEARAALARVGLKDDRFFSSYPHQLSGGQRQRVVFAQALACEPALLIADEPTASLDAHSQAEIIDLLKQLRAETGLTVLLISHSPEVQASLADRVVILKEGRILETGAFEELYDASAHSYTRKLLGVTGAKVSLSELPSAPRSAQA
ncbi:MAG TPA: ABC transporter ATP-binding protein [Candidatus Acidoferrales bacterium]|nr:ABC transporter ATP-binding protein [Candidatus Acidoferrales bacterium]